MSEKTDFPTHYADDEEWGPLCRFASDGDLMSFFSDDVTCERCRIALGDEIVVVVDD